ncbi:unnamed protein product, partial [Symbiodinium microadriaticum]
AAVDTTLAVPVSRPGGTQPNADRVPGTTPDQAARRKRLRAMRAKTRGLPAQVGGRFSWPRLVLVNAPSQANVLPNAVQRGKLAVAAQCALAYSLLGLPGDGGCS